MTTELTTSDRRLYHAKKRWDELFKMELRHEDERRLFLGSLLDAELAVLIDDADLFGQTNCGWFEYAAMHKTAAEARVQQYQRLANASAVPA